MFFITLISSVILWIPLSSQLIELTPNLISSLDKDKKQIAFIYYSSEDIFILKAIESLQNEFSDYLFAYVDTTISANMLSYFRISNLNQTGFIIYNFDKQIYYVEEHITSVKEVRELLNQSSNNTLNWTTQSMIEKIGWWITGKRLGQKAHYMFSFILCIIAIAVYTAANIYAKKTERKEIEKKLQ